MAEVMVGGVLHVYIVVIFTSLSFYGGSCYNVKVVIQEDNGTNNIENYNIVNKVVLPFSLQVDDYSDELSARADANDFTPDPGVKVSGMFGNIRYRRSLDKFSLECIHPHNVSKLVTADIGEAIHLPCRSCLQNRRDVYKSKQWFKLEMFPSPEGLYHIKEVEIDAHDDESRNRITTSLDHTLIIKNARGSDSGSYICRQTGDGDSFINLRLEWDELADFLSKTSRILHFYHVDVIDFEKSEVIDTSVFSSKKELKPQNISILNVEVFTNWYPWSPCAACDVTGIRKRFGLCNVRKLNKTDFVPNVHLEHILNLSSTGVPCQSELLGDFPHELWLSRPNEIQNSECYEPCKHSNSRRLRRGIPLVFAKINDIKERDNGKQPKFIDDDITETKKVTVDTYLILKCPGAKLRRTVLWVRGTKLETTDDMIKYDDPGTSIDMFGSIHFKKLTLGDTGIYSCWLLGDLTRKFVITVVEDRRTLIKRYTIYLLYSFIGDFAVFIGLVILKHFNRSVQRRVRRIMKFDTPEDCAESVEDEDNEVNDFDESSGSDTTTSSSSD